MKKVFKMISLCVLTIALLAGCAMKGEYGIKIGKDKDVNLEFIVAYDDEMLDGLLSMKDMGEENSDENKTYTDADRWGYLEDSVSDSGDFSDFKKSKYDKDGYKGYTFTMNLGKIDDLIATNANKIDIDKITKDSKIFTKDGDNYSLNLKVGSEDNTQMEEYAETIKFDVKLKVTLPNEAKENNATSVSGNTYTWDLTSANDIKLVFAIDPNAKDNTDNNTTDNNTDDNKTTTDNKDDSKKTSNSDDDNTKYFIIGGCVLGAIIIIVIIVLASNKSKKNAATTVPVTTMPSTPVENTTTTEPVTTPPEVTETTTTNNTNTDNTAQ